MEVMNIYEKNNDFSTAHSSIPRTGARLSCGMAFRQVLCLFMRGYSMETI